MRAGRFIGLAAVFLVACPRPARRADDPLLPLLDTIDIAWDARTTSFDDVDAAVGAAVAVRPDDPRVLWRVARLHVGRGLAASSDVAASRAFSRAREAGLRCLEAAPGFSDRWGAGAWTEAMATLSPDFDPCVEYTTIAWVRWLDAFGGAAGAWDLPRIDALVERMPGDLRADPFRRRAWIRGVLFVVRPEDDGQDLDLGRKLLTNAADHWPSELVRHADLLRLVLDPSGDTEAAEAVRARLRSMDAVTPEDRRAKARVLRTKEPAGP